MAGPFYYLTDFSDETMPCQPTLEAWAQWLALPTSFEAKHGWGRPEVVEDGAVFTATVMEELEDVEAEYCGGGRWRFSREVEPDATFFAVRYGRGMGRDVESIQQTLAELLTAQLEELGVRDPGDELLIAVCRDRPSVQVRYTRGPPPACTDIGQAH